VKITNVVFVAPVKSLLGSSTPVPLANLSVSMSPRSPIKIAEHALSLAAQFGGDCNEDLVRSVADIA
jgi:hypothetical protein